MYRCRRNYTVIVFWLTRATIIGRWASCHVLTMKDPLSRLAREFGTEATNEPPAGCTSHILLVLHCFAQTTQLRRFFETISTPVKEAET